MSVLKKIGAILAAAGADVAKFFNLPFVAQILGYLPIKTEQAVETGIQKVETVAGDLTSITKILVMAEAMYQAVGGQKTGSQKLAAAAPLVQKEILLWAQSNLPGHSKLQVSAEEFAADVQAWISPFVKILNDFGE